jgi:hypothetical protein
MRLFYVSPIDETKEMVVMPLVVKGRESVAIEEGKHKGVIRKVEKRTSDEGYVYIDISLTVDDMKNSDGEPVIVKCGCPIDMTKNTKLGKVVMNFGVTPEEIDAGEDFDLEKIFAVGKKVTYLTKNEPANDLLACGIV